MVLASPPADPPPPAITAPRLSRSAWVGLLLAVLVVAYTGSTRYLDPVGEKYVDFMTPGGGDFVVPYNGARGLLMGENPYNHNNPALFDPWGRDQMDRGFNFRQAYPPSHLSAYMPLVIISGGDFRVGSRIWFHLNLACLIALCFVSCGLVGHMIGWRGPPRELWVLLLPWLPSRY